MMIARNDVQRSIGDAPRILIIPKGSGTMNRDLLNPKITTFLEANSEKTEGESAAVVRRQTSISSGLTTIDT